MEDQDIQREYYTATASSYDDIHAAETPSLALAVLDAVIADLGIKTLLDIGSGTGRILERLPHLDAKGIEPVAALRAVGHRRGIPADRLTDGDATRLSFADNSVDLVTAFAVLHHIRRPELAIAEMLRVARVGIVICDANNFGQGSRLARLSKQVLNSLGLWPLANFVKTRGKGYSITPGDGLAYSYSVFRNYAQIEQACARVHILNLAGGGRNAYREAPAVLLLALKK